MRASLFVAPRGANEPNSKAQNGAREKQRVEMGQIVKLLAAGRSAHSSGLAKPAMDTKRG
jgi:hypothetical protein